MSHGKLRNRGKYQNRKQKCARNCNSHGGGLLSPLFAVGYLDEFFLARCSTPPRAGLPSLHPPSLRLTICGHSVRGKLAVSLFSQRMKARIRIRNADALGHTINTHTMRISKTQETVDAITFPLERDGPSFVGTIVPRRP